MRALIIAESDVGGCLAHLARYLRAQGAADVRLVTLDRDPAVRFTEDICAPLDGGAEARGLLEHAEALHLVDLDPTRAELFGSALGPALARRPRPGIIEIDRAPEGHWAALAEAAGELGWPLITTRPAAAARTGARLLPPFVPLWAGPWRPLAADTRMRESVRRPAVVFASARIPLRRRPRLEALIDAAEARMAPAQVLETVVGRCQRELLRRRRYAHLCLTEGRSGLPLSAFEALAQGVPVVSDTPPGWVDAYAALGAGPPPVFRPGSLDELIAGLAPRAPGDPSLRVWAERALDPRRWGALCTAAYAGELPRAAA